MAYAVAILLVSALTTVGLLALWAATSRATWFWRTMGCLAAIAPVLLIPAYEPFVAFVIQGAVVAAGIQLAKWRTARNNGESFFESRFSLRTVLLAMVPIGVLSAVTVRVPELNWYAWQSVILIGLGGGLATLAAWWVTYGRYDNWKMRGLLALLIVSTVSIPVFCGDHFIISVDGITGWPPDPAALGMINLFGTYTDGAPALIWTPILLAVATLTAIFSGLIRGLVDSESTRHLVRFRTGVAVLLLLIMAVPAALVYTVLMNPLRIPIAQIPNPNGYNDFLSAVELLPAKPLVNSGSFDSETASEQELEQASNEIATVLDWVRKGFDKDAMKALSYGEVDLALPDIQGFRTISRGFDAQGRLLLRQNQPVESANIFIDGARFGTLLSHGGLMIDDLVGIACSGIAYRGLHTVVEQLPIEQIPLLVAELQRLETERDSWEDVIYRDRVWSQCTYGWYGQLQDLLSQYFDNGWNTTEAYQGARLQELAVIRLLQLELSQRLWQAEHEGWPESINELVPAYIPEIPIDPLSPEGERIKSARNGERLIFYSVGRNQKDENGAVAEDDGGYRDHFTGDLRLDILYESEP
jgi:hypothetical protein